VKQIRLYILLSISYFLVACGTAPTTRTTPEPELVSPVDIKEVSMLSKRLAEIESTYLVTKDINARNQSLLVLATTFKNEANCNSAEIVVKHIQTSIQNQAQQAYANLLKAECALESLEKISDFTNKQPLLDLISTWLNHAQQTSAIAFDATFVDTGEFTTRTQIAYATLLADKGQYFPALKALLMSGNAIDFIPQPEYSNTIWKWFSLVERNERVALTNRFGLLNDYKTLLDTIEDSTINDNTRQTTINQWLLANANSEVANNLPQQVQNYLAISNRNNQNIAVLLPLSGRLSGQGEVIKQGILSAYYDRLAKPSSAYTDQVSIEFIDTGSLSNIKETINHERLLSYDTIIGPLLRTHIEQIEALNLTGKRQLLLNQSADVIDKPNILIASFSLSPEQEAEQLVALMRKQNISNPVIISDGSSMTRRMNDAFIAAWETSKLTDTRPHSLQQIQYTDNKSMRVGITSALDVLQSKNRIQQLSNISQERVYSVTRNRRDIDAFVVFARPNDVELINPIIETSISLFTNEQIPVFATSYSYDHKQSKNSQRDLRNLVFVDMPWLLPKGREQALSKNVDTLFNQPPSAFLRLFAFGYDSLALVDNLVQLSTFAHMSINGLSGVLSINQKQQLTRELASLSITSGSGTN
jgi:hypothetical protein